MRKIPLIFIALIIFSKPAFSQDAVILLNERKGLVNIDGTMNTTIHRIIKINNPSFWEKFKEITISYNKDLDEVIVDEIKVNEKLTEPKTIDSDETTKSVRFNTKRIFIPKCEAGDILEYKITIKRFKPLIRNHFFNILVTQDIYPIERSEFTITIPKKMPLYYQSVGFKLNPRVIRDSKNKIYTFIVGESPAIEKDLSDRTERIIVSSTNSWNDVGSWFYKLYEDASKPDEKIKDKALELTRDKVTIEEKVKALFDYVVNYIAYFTEEFGMDALRPRKASLVLDKRIGDCKDKVALLISMLKVTGLKSYPALLNTKSNLDLSTFLPTPYYFNHVIVYLPIKEKTFFLDPTLSIDHSVIPDECRNKKALVILGSLSTFVLLKN